MIMFYFKLSIILLNLYVMELTYEFHNFYYAIVARFFFSHAKIHSLYRGWQEPAHRASSWREICSVNDVCLLFRDYFIILNHTK